MRANSNCANGTEMKKDELKEFDYLKNFRKDFRFLSLSNSVKTGFDEFNKFGVDAVLLSPPGDRCIAFTSE